MDIVKIVHRKQFIDVCVFQEILQVLGFAQEHKDVERIIAIRRKTGKHKKNHRTNVPRTNCLCHACVIEWKGSDLDSIFWLAHIVICGQFFDYLSRADAYVKLHPTCVDSQTSVSKKAWLTWRIRWASICAERRWGKRRDCSHAQAACTVHAFTV